VAVVILHVHKYGKKVTRKLKLGGGGLHERHVVETWEPSQHSLDTGKQRKTCVEVTSRRTFLILTSGQQSGI